jgi:hypothetical protein
MTNGKTVSYKVILGNVLRNHPWCKNYLTDEHVLEWLGSFMQHANAPAVLTNKIEFVEVSGGRGELPSDLHLLHTVGNVSNCLNLTVEELECGKGSITPMRWATDYYHKRYHKDDRDYTRRDAHETYTLNDNYVFPSFTSGIVAIAYDAIPTDKEGNPMIPADEQWVKAAEFEIAYRIGYMLWTIDKLKDKVFSMLERDRDWYFAQAVNYSKIPSVDEMHGITIANDHGISSKDSGSTPNGGNSTLVNKNKNNDVVDPENTPDHDHISFNPLPNLPS